MEFIFLIPSKFKKNSTFFLFFIFKLTHILNIFIEPFALT